MTSRALGPHRTEEPASLTATVPELILSSSHRYAAVPITCVKKVVNGELRGADLTTGRDNSPITSLRARHLTLTDCTLSDATALNSYLYGVTLVGCNLRETLLSRSTIEHTRFIDCDLTRTSFTYAQMHNVTFTNCNLDQVDLYGAIITTLLLPHGPTPALLEGAYIDAESLLPQGYQREPATPVVDLSEHPPSPWNRDGKLSIQRISHDLAYLTRQANTASSSALEFLLREHPRSSTASLLALASALAVS